MEVTKTAADLHRINQERLRADKGTRLIPFLKEDGQTIEPK
jgi:hypothetical protein